MKDPGQVMLMYGSTIVVSLITDHAVAHPALWSCTGSYEGTVQISDKVPHSAYRLMVEGQGKPGFVKGNAAIALRPEGETTIVDVSGSVETGGPIARLGQRLIGNVSKMMQDRFFACLQGKI